MIKNDDKICIKCKKTDIYSIVIQLNNFKPLNFRVMSNRIKNHVQLVGRLGKDPEVRHLESGQVVANFPLATSEFYNDRKGQKIEDTQWHNLVAWGKVAELIEKYVTKGKEVAITGRLTNRSWEQQDGNTRYITEVVVQDVLLMGGRGNGQTSEEGDTEQDGNPEGAAATTDEGSNEAKPKRASAKGKKAADK